MNFNPVGVGIGAGLLVASAVVSPWFLAVYAGYILYSSWDGAGR